MAKREVYRTIPDKFDGKKWHYKVDGPLRVMGEVEGYLIVRKPRAMPFCLHKNDAVTAEGKKDT